VLAELHPNLTAKGSGDLPIATGVGRVHCPFAAEALLGVLCPGIGGPEALLFAPLRRVGGRQNNVRLAGQTHRGGEHWSFVGPEIPRQDFGMGKACGRQVGSLQAGPSRPIAAIYMNIYNTDYGITWDLRLFLEFWLDP